MNYIYKITNNANGKVYIGSTTNPKKRKTRHFSTLRSNTHHNILLQRAFNKYGESSLTFEIIHEFEGTREDMFEVEHTLLVELNPEYNIGSVGGGDNLTNNPNREKIIAKIKETINSNISSMTVEERKAKWGRSGELNPNWKGGISVSYCSCGNTKAREAKTCASCRDRSGENNPFHGKKHSEETRKKLSEIAKKRTKPPGNARAVIGDGKEFESLAAMARHYSITTSAAHYRVKSSAKKWEQFYYKNT